MNNDLISRSALLEEFEWLKENTGAYNHAELEEHIQRIKKAPAVDAEPVRHDGNTTFITTERLEAYTDRIIVIQGNWCKVYYRDSDDAEVEG